MRDNILSSTTISTRCGGKFLLSSWGGWEFSLFSTEHTWSSALACTQGQAATQVKGRSIVGGHRLGTFARGVQSACRDSGRHAVGRDGIYRGRGLGQARLHAQLLEVLPLAPAGPRTHGRQSTTRAEFFWGVAPQRRKPGTMRRLIETKVRLWKEIDSSVPPI